MQLLLLWLGLCSLGAGPSGKLDTGLAGATGMQPVFVRMEAQLFKKGGDYERFCADHEKDPRSEVRGLVLRTLHKNADASWVGIKSFVSEWETRKGLQNVRRFWIVNGFACDASAEACQALAKRDDVSFVYLQSGPAGIRQHRRRAKSAGVDATRKRAMEAMLAAWKDDSNTPFSGKGLEVPWDLKQIQADQVWAQGITGKGTVVAVNDAGIFDIPALEPALWRNPKETLNGKDDDGNGYVDDVFGWDAGEQSGLVLGNAGVGHGTMCSAIVAGRPTAEKPLVTGVAPRARLMLVNGMGYLGGFEYALANGADVFSMSYMFVNIEIGNYRGVYRLAAEHMSAAGVLLCGGAGNFANSAPEGKQITIPKDIPCVVAAAGTVEDGSRPAFSSKGPVTWSGVKFYDDYPAEKPLVKPDLSAPAGGFACWNLASEARPQWKVLFKGAKGDALLLGPQGNSFAGPHTAGVAALLFSMNKELNTWQVKRILEETCKDMGASGRDVLHGAGLVQALAAVRKAREAGRESQNRLVNPHLG
ncbi:MAG: S8 family serine peptidase [Fimbriimonadaceae bacterium]|nr:S8 family serine peptidase [Fimbriimonadaceae bacterium]